MKEEKLSEYEIEEQIISKKDKTINFLKENNKLIKTGLFILLLIIIFIVATTYYDSNNNSTKPYMKMNSKEVIDIAQNSGTKNHIIQVDDKNTYHITKDGIKLLNKKYKSEWENVFNFSNVHTSSSGEYVAITELNTESSYIFVYDKKGLKYSISPSAEVEYIHINKNGYLSVIYSNNDKYTATVFNSKGDQLLNRIIEEDNEYPLSAIVAPDNKTLLITYLDITNINSKIVIQTLPIYKEDSVNNGEKDEIADELEFYSEGLLSIKFLENDNCVILTNKNIYIYNIVDFKFEQITTIENQNIYKYFDVVDNYIIGVVGESLPASQGYNSNSIVIYKKDDLKNVIEYEGDISYFKLYPFGMIVGDGKNFTTIDLTGDVMWEYSTQYDTYDVIVLDEGRTAIFIGRNNVDKVKFK